MVLLHGLEGSADSTYMRGIAEKALRAGFNAIRLNQRGCGGSESLGPTLYHSGLSGDLRSTVMELIEHDKLREIFVCGYSMGGNLALKMVGEFGADAPREIAGLVTVAPAIDLSAVADAIDSTRNYIYRRHFINALEARHRRKSRLFPDRYKELRPSRTLREFDDVVTAPAFGFSDAADYYYRSSALRVVQRIAISTLIIAAEDDTFVPVRIFHHPDVTANPRITTITPAHGGHCGFISRFAGPHRFWAEAAVIEFCRERSKGENIRTGG